MATTAFVDALVRDAPADSAERETWVDNLVEAFHVAAAGLDRTMQARARFDAVAVLQIFATTGGEPTLARQLLLGVMEQRGPSVVNESGFERPAKHARSR